MDSCAGLDVSLRSCALCVVDEKGTVRHERELPCEVEAIADALARFPNPAFGGLRLGSRAINPRTLRKSGGDTGLRSRATNFGGQNGT